MYLNLYIPDLQREICDGLTADKIETLARKWLRLLPHAFSRQDRQAGYRYDVSILQAVERAVVGVKAHEPGHSLTSLVTAMHRYLRLYKG
jgi:hypothetical protein